MRVDRIGTVLFAGALVVAGFWVVTARLADPGGTGGTGPAGGTGGTAGSMMTTTTTVMPPQVRRWHVHAARERGHLLV